MSENLLFLWRFSFSASHFVDDLKTTISTASSVSDVTEIIKFRIHARAMHHFSSRTTSYEAMSSMRKVPIVLIVRGCLDRTHGLNNLFLHLMRALCFCLIMISHLVFIKSTNRASERASAIPPHRIYKSLLRMRAIHELKRMITTASVKKNLNRKTFYSFSIQIQRKYSIFNLILSLPD